MSVIDNIRPSFTDPKLSGMIRFGWVVLGVFLLTIVLYAVVGRVNAAVIASAIVRVDLHRRPVQHREGGTVDRVFVKEGQSVKAGDLLLGMRDVAVDASVDLVTEQILMTEVRLARLEAERTLAPRPIYPTHIVALASKNRSLEDTIQRESGIFESRKATLAKHSDLIRQQIVEATGQQSSFEAQATALGRAHELAQEELGINRSLLEQRFVQRTNVLAIERAAEDLLSRQEEARANQSSAQRQIKQLQMQLSALTSEYREAAALEHQENAAKVAELEQRLRPSSDAADRLKLHAPVAGRVVNLKVNSPGAVIAAGETIMEIVPADDKLVFDAKVSPEDISRVATAAAAEVRLTGMRFRRSIGMEGKVTAISADALTDDRTGVLYFSVLVEVPYEELEKNADIAVAPGIPADVFILTESRTILWYLIEPAADYLRKAFREA